MTTLDFSAELDMPLGPLAPDEAELAAVAFLARYSGRTLDAYRHDLRNLFQWAADHGLAVLEATRAHLELYRASMEEERGLAASTIDRRLSTACGFYRFAHIDGRIASNPAQYVRRPQVPSVGATRTRPGRARPVPLRRRAGRPRPRSPRGAARLERTSGQRGLRNQHRGHVLRARSPGVEDRRERQQAGPDRAGASHRPNHRPRHR
jgi:integrase